MKLRNKRTGSKEIIYSERVIIQDLITISLSYAEIARNLNRAVGSIKNEVNRNGGRNDYSAHSAQNRADMQKKRRTQKTVDIFSKNNLESNSEITELKQKIENIEQQIEIILDILKSPND